MFFIFIFYLDFTRPTGFGQSYCLTFLSMYYINFIFEPNKCQSWSEEQRKSYDPTVLLKPTGVPRPLILTPVWNNSNLCGFSALVTSILHENEPFYNVYPIGNLYFFCNYIKGWKTHHALLVLSKYFITSLHSLELLHLQIGIYFHAESFSYHNNEQPPCQLFPGAWVGMLWG